MAMQMHGIHWIAKKLIEDGAPLPVVLLMKIAFIFLRFIFSLPEPFGIFEGFRN